MTEKERKRQEALNALQGQAASGIVPIGYTSTAVTSPSSSTTTVTPSKASIAAQTQIATEEAEADRIRRENIEREREIAKGQLEEAEGKRQAAEEHEIQRQEADKRIAEERARWIAQEQAQQKEVDAKSKPTSYYEDESTPARILRALILGAAGSVGNDTPMKIYDQAAAADRQKKMDALAFEQKKLERLGVSKEEALRALDAGKANIDRMEIAKLKQLALTAEIVAKKNPASVQAAQQFAADARAKAAEKEAERAKEYDVKRVANTGQSTTTSVTGEKPGAGGSGVTEAESKKAQYAQQILDDVKTIENGPKLTPAERRTLANNVLSVRSTIENATKGFTGAAKAEALRKLGLNARSFFDGIPQNKIPVATAWASATGLIIRDQSGAAITNSEDVNNWNLKGLQETDDDKTAAYRLATIKRQAQTMRALAGPNALNRLQQGGIIDGDKPRQFSKDDATAAQWALENKGTQKAKDIIIMLRAKYGN